MRHTYRIIIVFCLIFTANSYASNAPFNFFLDALYWQATETVDWVLANNRNASNQTITYETAKFKFDPGFRLGFGYKNNWETRLYYTSYYTKTNSSTTGNLVSTFMGGKVVQGNSFFYRSGQLNFKINFNMLDLDLAKSFNITETITFRPLIGLRGGWIYQTINTSFQGTTSISEIVKNDFKGIGPKAGLESAWLLHKNNSYQFNLIANFAASFLYGTWDISDIVHDTSAVTLYINAGRRHLGALTLEALLGVGMEHKNFKVNLGYEISDWFNQYQVFDDGTGAHNNDLILQGLNLRLSYNF